MPHRRSYKNKSDLQHEGDIPCRIAPLQKVVESLVAKVRKFEKAFALRPELYEALQVIESSDALSAESEVGPPAVKILAQDLGSTLLRQSEAAEQLEVTNAETTKFNAYIELAKSHAAAVFHIGDAHLDERPNDHFSECELACAYEFIELEDAPRVASDSSDFVEVADENLHHQNVQAQNKGMEETINLAVLRVVNDAFSATVPMIISNMQSRIDESCSRLEMKVDTQRAELATLAGYMASSKRNAKR